MASSDEAELEFLSTASEKWIIGVSVVPPWKTTSPEQMAFEACILQEWIRLIDVVEAPNLCDDLMKVFLVTPAGRNRLTVLKEQLRKRV